MTTITTSGIGWRHSYSANLSLRLLLLVSEAPSVFNGHISPSVLLTAVGGGLGLQCERCSLKLYSQISTHRNRSPERANAHERFDDGSESLLVPISPHHNYFRICCHNDAK